MELTSMELPEQSKEEVGVTALGIEQDQWPYGLQLTFNKEQISALPSLADYKVGDRVLISAEACVTAVRMSERKKGEDDHSIEMQIEKVGCEPLSEKDVEEMNPREYESMRKKGMGKGKNAMMEMKKESSID
jgi:hypothetical protein